MAVFTYKATDFDASVIDGTLVADTPRQARDQLRQRGLTVHDIAAHKEQGARRWAARFSWRRPRANQVVSFVRELSTLLGVGMPLLEAIDTISRQQRGAFREVLLVLRDRIASGASLAEAMAEQSTCRDTFGATKNTSGGGVFDAITVNMVEVGENAGTLETVLEELAAFKERSAQLKGKLGGALLYPLIVLATGIGVSIFLMTYVVPGLLGSLIEAGKPLPLITQVVKAISDTLLTKWWLLLLVAGAVIAGCAALYRTRTGRRLYHRAVLRLPGVGDLVRKQAVVRIAFILSTLMRSGIAFEKAIAIAQRSTSNLILRDALEQCERAVEAGRDIGEALDQTDAFPDTVVQVFALGQQSGRMEEMLDRLAVDYDRQVTTAAAHLTSILEPVLILLLALIVGAIAFATILPILEVGNVL